MLKMWLELQKCCNNIADLIKGSARVYKNPNRKNCLIYL